MTNRLENNVKMQIIENLKLELKEVEDKLFSILLLEYKGFTDLVNEDELMQVKERYETLGERIWELELEACQE